MMGVMLLWSIRSNNLPLTVLKGCNIGNRSRVLLLKNGRRLIGKRQIRPASCSTTYGGRAGRLAPGGAPSPRAGFHSFGSRRGPGKGLLRLNIQERLIPLPRIGRHGRDKIVRSGQFVPIDFVPPGLFRRVWLPDHAHLLVYHAHRQGCLQGIRISHTFCPSSGRAELKLNQPRDAEVWDRS